MNSVIDEIVRLRSERKLVEEKLVLAHRELVGDMTGFPEAAAKIGLSYSGRMAEASAEPGHPGVPTLSTHLAQCSDASSWVQARIDRWIKLALEIPSN